MQKQKRERERNRMKKIRRNEAYIELVTFRQKFPCLFSLPLSKFCRNIYLVSMPLLPFRALLYVVLSSPLSNSPFSLPPSFSPCLFHTSELDIAVADGGEGEEGIDVFLVQVQTRVLLGLPMPHYHQLYYSISTDDV